jgi:hypothetical protein
MTRYSPIGARWEFQSSPRVGSSLRVAEDADGARAAKLEPLFEADGGRCRRRPPYSLTEQVLICRYRDRGCADQLGLSNRAGFVWK